MKLWLAGCIAAWLLSSATLSLAVEEHHETQSSDTATSVLPPNTMPTTPAKPPSNAVGSKRSGTQSSSASAMAQIDEQMRKMQSLHERMMTATTPEERQKAMADARKEMDAGMKMMQPMMRDHAMDGQMGGMMRGPSGGSGAQMQMMSKRLDMMQMMMQMMMDQQAMTMPQAEKRP